MLAGISGILILLMFSVFYVIYQFSDLNQRFSKVVDLNAERIILSDDIMKELMGITIKEKNIILEKDLTVIRESENEVNLAIVRVDNYLLELESIISVEEKQLLAGFKSSWTAYIQEVKETITLSKENAREEAFKLSTGPAKLVRQQAIGILSQVIDRNKAKMERDKIASNKIYTDAFQFIIILVGLSFLTTGMLAYWLVRTVSSRIQKISDDAKRIASRELTDIKIEDQVHDELHPIAESLNDILESFREIAFSAEKVASGDYSMKITPRSEHDQLGYALKKMKESLVRTTATNQQQNWSMTGLNLLNESLRGEQSILEITEKAICFLSEYVGANIGALYLLQSENKLNLTGKYAFTPREHAKQSYSFGEGLVGQVAVKKDLLHISPYSGEDLKISSATLDMKPTDVLVVPFFFDGTLLGVIELGKLKPFSSVEIEFLMSTMELMGININSAINRERINNLLEETQAQGEELEVQQEELRQANEELEEQTQNLKYQQEELQVANEELEEQAHQLDAKNKQLEKIRVEVEQKSLQVEESSRYKSQFLANMSHELRTPLNSLLILSKDMADNKQQNLDEVQVESARIIYKSGQDLLQLINEVLDLSKIEAGKMDLNIEDLRLTELAESIHRNFGPSVQQKGLTLSVNIDPALPKFITTDIQRLEQIVKNLLSNAIKFTERGGIIVNFKELPDNQLSIDVKDTGIGIPEDKQALIFEAFQQADGTTSRKYGGTGLGLSISKQLAQLLGGSIKLVSNEQEGTCFSLIVPALIEKKEIFEVVPKNLQKRTSPGRPAQVISMKAEFENYPSIPDDRNTIANDDKTLLIVEDDLYFAEILKKQANGKGFKVLAASTGEDALLLAGKYKPKAIILDLVLPGMQGRVVLNELKRNPDLRHIPVHVISSHERTLDVIREGALEYLTKPVDKEQLEKAFMRIENFINKKMKSLLVVEDDEDLRKAIKRLIGSSDVEYFEAETGRNALEIIKTGTIDCVVLDLGLPDISGIELLKKLQQQKGKIPPIIIYTGKELSKEESDELQDFAETIIIKGVKSEERLLDETALFLHRTVSELPEAKKDILIELYDKEAVFKGKKILIADDDMRNVFALSKVLREHGMEILKAENGQKAVEALKAHEDVSLVLMDIMMPVIDGIEAMKKIRAVEKFQNIPIVAITAKAMKEDRNKCIEAGANDYISKPVEIERLLSLMRVWIKK